MRRAISITKTLHTNNQINPSISPLYANVTLPRFLSTSSASSSSSSSSSFSSTDDPLHTTSSQPQSQPKHQGRNVRGIWAKLLLFVPGAITFGLGTWQIFRRQDKIKMLEYRKERLEMEPIQLNAVSATENPDILEFRKIVCKGAFDEKKSIFVGPRSRSISGVTENGYYIITPLFPIPGDPESVQSPVLVNRGWVPRSWRDKALDSSVGAEETRDVTSPSSSQIERRSWKFWSKKPEKIEEQLPTVSRVEVVGVVRGSEKPSIFVPANDPASGQWFFVDVPNIAHALGLPEDTMYMEDTNENATPSNPYPVPKDAGTLIRCSVMPQDHLNYTLTWYSLSAAVTFMAYKRLKPRKSRR